MNASAAEIARALKLPLKIAQDMRRDLVATETSGSNSDVERSLKLANKAIDAHGVEAIRGKYVDRYFGDIVAEYVNTGDTYNTTIVFDTTTRRFALTSWGDFVERNQRRYQIT